MRFSNWKSKAKVRNISFELAIDDLKNIPKVCYYSGRLLTSKQNRYDTISLDRLNSSKGYTKDNVVFCCEFINKMKNDLTYDQFIYACKIISEYHKNKL